MRNYARAFFVKSVMERVELFVKMIKGWLFLPIAVFVSLLGNVCDYLMLPVFRGNFPTLHLKFINQLDYTIEKHCHELKIF